MQDYRDAGPHYPKLIIDEFAEVTFMEDIGPDNDNVISCAPGDLPKGFEDRKN